MSKRKKKRWVSDDDTTDFNENWLLDFALSNTGEHGLANTLDEIEEWASASLTQNVGHQNPLPFPWAGQTLIARPPDAAHLFPTRVR